MREKRKSLEEKVVAAMALEETGTSMAALSVDESGSFLNPSGKGKENPEPKKGEFVAEEDSTDVVNKPVANQTHSLEHAWTFWFDNPSAKSKQAAWGASMRPIYTFSTVEEFWRFVSLFSLSINYLIMFLRT